MLLFAYGCALCIYFIKKFTKSPYYLVLKKKKKWLKGLKWAEMLNGQKCVASFRQWSDPKLLDHFDETEQKLTTRLWSPNISLIRRQAEKQTFFSFLVFLSGFLLNARIINAPLITKSQNSFAV